MIREDLERLEVNILSPYASLSSKSKGRIIETEKCDFRTEYQRDRDKILHCNSFRRLKHKTQVFLSPQGDHYRTRLTHTLEVSQIARTISRCLRLNEDLTEAIALGHDLGHTPFGHAGEYVLNELHDGGFLHNIQSVRVVDHIENYGKGLNLTYEVKNGIACHSDNLVDATTLEGRVVRISDKIAYINHDIEDAIRAGVLRESDLPYDSIYILGRTKSERITTMIQSIVEYSKDDIQMADEVLKAHNGLKAFMFENVYSNSEAKSEDKKAQDIVKVLYEYYLHHVNELPDFYHTIIEKFGMKQAVCDYVAGMTDQFAVELYKEMYIPKFWSR
ncbi:deoxyguanosinetriphosphate triphosphohydrolase [Paludicola sp. MB14-C6]|uniref:deoxyguanosinetriphosphate triphosphohydrolase n=1 Tax=Paludihabitans sp. MB14-C6 TaxID=3070656 RepID=UPI0027DD3545|nr:deoxyguanosinetriphosphate triphosphohydrolase [Paludicola sp. MB14-C6]WMJ23797.1 deoxyguanosinetriphosphate triphosphohydrolase [Paludicola sp. MB14-C6]